MAEAVPLTTTGEHPTPERDPAPFETLIGVLFKPRATFERLREAQRGHWWVVFVLAFAALVLVTLATVPIQAQVTQAALAEQMADMPAEQQAQVEQTQAIFSSQAMLGAISTASGTVVMVIGYLLRALVLFLLGLALGGRTSFRQVWQMAVWTTLPNVARNLVAAIASFVTGGLSAPGLTYIYTSTELAEVSPILQAVLRNIDIYAMWGLALIAVGVIATSRFSRIKGAAVAIIYWLITLGAAAGLAAIGQAFGNALGIG